MRHILPRPGRVIRGHFIVAPAGPGMVCLAYGPAQEAVPAAGVWTDTVATSAAHAAAIARQRPVPDVRVTFHGATLALNGLHLTATAIGGRNASPPATEPPKPPLMDLPLFAYRPRARPPR